VAELVTTAAMINTSALLYTTERQGNTGEKRLDNGNGREMGKREEGESKGRSEKGRRREGKKWQISPNR